ncbi:cytosine permease [Salipaludibacillus sp. CUR1]|uniref:purine-cytosine permease family protein n=1 Tax=Salipaludibacillus sp. CUR1 TaxID=2820003 RepID=UPI001E52C041|nr:cytosine permease [Salipaludibacillus sp. CUR1]MCE7792106.1 cytosine permease [Salipaludibacillus sp. CUR1]
MSSEVKQLHYHSKIERLGLEPVPKHLKTTTAADYIKIQMGISVNAGNMLVPALAVLEGGLTFTAAVLSTVAGAWIAFLFVSLLSLPGAKYGLPAQYVIRTMIGDKGAMWLSSPVRTVTSLYWFSVQTIGGTYMVQEILSRGFNIHLPFTLLSMVLAVAMVCLALIGFQAIRKVTAYFIPLLLFSAAGMFYVFITSHPEGASFTEVIYGEGMSSIPVMLFYASLAFVQYVSGVSSSADMARYSKSSKHAFFGIYIGNGLGFLITALLGAYTAAAAGHWNPFLISSQWTGSGVLLIVIMVSALFSMVTINMNNAYTGGYSLLNTFPKLKRIRSALLFGGAGIILSGVPQVVDEAEVFISALGALIIPLSGVVVADYVIVKKLSIPAEALNYLAKGGNKINIPAFMTVFAGILLYLFIPEGYSPGFAVFNLSVLCYTILYLMTRRRHPCVL